MRIKFTSLLIMLLVVISCSEKRDNDQEKLYDEELSKLISKVTNGKIPSNENIKIWFNEAVVKGDAINKEFDDDVLSIDPSVDGKLFWQNSNLLVFQPEEPFEFRKHYRASLDVKKLSDDFKDKPLEKFNFDFEILGRELFAFKGEVSLKNPKDPNIVNYRGKLTFTEKTDLENVKEAVSLEGNGKDYNVELFSESDGRTFSFISDDIIRDKTTKDFKFILDKNPLDISEDFIEEFQVTTLEELKISSIAKLEDDLTPKVRIEFSDELAFEQNIQGLVNFDNKSNLKIQKMGNSILVDGDFEFGKEYKISIEPGIRSKWGTKLKKKFAKLIKFDNKNPQLKFASDGVFLPQSNQYKLQFYTINLKRVHLEVKMVYENNIAEFISSEKLSSNEDRKQAFNGSYINRVGVIIHNETFEISSDKNKSLLSEIDLTDIVKNYQKGLYLIRLNFNPRDILVDGVKDKYRFIEEEGQIYKPIIFSNIGLTCKKSGNKYKIYATDLITGKPLDKVKVRLKSLYRSNKIVSESNTDKKGMASLIEPKKRYYGNLYLEAEKNGERSIIKFYEMQWNLSGFNVGGVDELKSGIKTFIYSDRGVYRPGDEINLSVIARHVDKDFPDNHPITLSLFNPQRKKVYELTNKKNIDGFYCFNIKTKDSDPTGNWRADFHIGNDKFSHIVKIETVVPYRLKVKINPEHKKLLWNHKKLNFDVQSNYLFGNPASDLPVEVELEIDNINKHFPNFTNFIFSNPSVDFKKIKKSIFKGNLNENGKKEISWEIPTFSNLSSALNIKVTATVTEKGGRPNKTWINIPVEPYSQYVGIQPVKYGYVKTGSDVEFPVILVDVDGKPVVGKTIKYRIYRNSKHWWWHYGKDRRLKYKTDYNTILVKEGSLTSNKEHTNIKFVPIDNGEYLVEAIDESGTGHTAGIFFSAYRYGRGQGKDKNAGTLALRSDKEKYFVGEKAKISFPAPKEGSILFTIEKWNSILEEKWYNPTGDDEMVIEVPLTKEMVPNAYVSISIIQPHAQTLNDRPIRTFGVLPLLVEDKETKHFIDIKTSSQFRPKEDFVIDLQTSNHKQTQFTIAVVDEGLLDITQFKTPDPWSYFFKKIRLAVNTYDIFSQIIAANIGDVFKTFSIGGDLDYRESQLQPEKSKKRFKPVSLFKGPLMTDQKGRASVKFKMPNYVGSVRIMVIGANKNSYAKAEKAVPVKSELMVLPTLPRVIGPGEKFTIPVSVFAMKDNIGKVNVKVKTEGPITIQNNETKSLVFNLADDKDCYFDITAREEVGQAKVSIIANSDKYTANYDVDIMVRPTSPRIYNSLDNKTAKGDYLNITIPNDGIKGTNRATLTLSNFPNINFGHRLKWLIHYPYGCIEQTTSSVFPQLFLKKFIKYPEAYSEDIDKNINIGLERLRNFQIFSGAFSYWPYENTVSDWGTLYAGHFMVEAKKLGYHVAEDLYLNWSNFTKGSAKKHSGNLMSRVYRCYILAVDGKAELSEMNTLMESQLDKLNNTQKWLLAATYKLAGLQTEAEMLVSNLGTTVKDYSEFSGSYGSALRDKAMILEAAVILEKFNIADVITKEITSLISSYNWYSTQTLSYSLMAIGKYMNVIQGENKNLVIKGYLEDFKGKRIPFNNEKTFNIKITEGFGKEIKIFIDKKTNTDFVYSTLSWDGVPLKSDIITENKNLKLSVSWLDENGNEFDPSEIKQGTTFYAKYTVKNTTATNNVDEVALLQILPSGWEIVNTRLLNETLPLWTSRYILLNREDYLDIRDDRVMWFFDLYERRIKNRDYKKLDFIVKLTAVTVGEYDLPGTLTEAMYNNNYRASEKGKRVKVIKP